MSIDHFFAPSPRPALGGYAQSAGSAEDAAPQDEAAQPEAPATTAAPAVPAALSNTSPVEPDAVAGSTAANAPPEAAPAIPDHVRQLFRPVRDFAALARVNPALGETFAPEIAQQNAEESAFNRAQAQRAREAAAAAKASTNAQNDAFLAQAIPTGQRHYKDSSGAIKPVIDPVTGTPLYQPQEGQVQYDPKTGTPTRTDRDQFGNTTTFNPDADAPVGPNSDDPTDPQLYRQNKFQSWQAIGHVDDLAGDETQPGNVRAAALKWQGKRGAIVADMALRTSSQRVADAQAALLGGQSKIDELSAQAQALQPQYGNDGQATNEAAQDALIAARPDEGGVPGVHWNVPSVGLPTHPAAGVVEARARMADRQNKIDDLNRQLLDLQEQTNDGKSRDGSGTPGALVSAVEAAEADHRVTTAALAYHKENERLANFQVDWIQRRRDLLASEGKSSSAIEKDPLLQTMLEAEAKLHVKRNAAQSALAQAQGVAASTAPSQPEQAAQPPAPGAPATARDDGGQQYSAIVASSAAQPPIGPMTAGQDGTPPAPPSTPPTPPVTPATLTTPVSGTPGVTTVPTSNAIGNAAREAVGGAAAGTLRVAEGFERSMAGQESATPESVSAGLDKQIADRQKALENMAKAPQAVQQSADFAGQRQKIERELATFTAQKANPRLSLPPGSNPALLTPDAQAKRDARVAAADETADTLRDATEEASTYFGQDPARKDTVVAKLARGAGAAVPLLVASRLPLGATSAAGTAALQSKASAYDGYIADAVKAGKVNSDGQPTAEAKAEAQQYSDIAAIKTLPQMISYLGAGKLAAGVTAKLLSPSTPAAVRFLVSTASATAANAAAGTVNRTYDQITSGQPVGLNYDPEQFAQDLIFGGQAGLHETAAASRANVAQAQRLQANPQSYNAVRQQVDPVTADTLSAHVLVPHPERYDAETQSHADASVAEGFAARNPGAPEIDPAVVAKAREFTPPGVEDKVTPAIAALDAHIQTLERSAEDDSQPIASQQAAQGKLAQAIQRKSAMLATSDAQLHAVQQISALPDWTPATDEHGQPTEPPDPAHKRETASALLKLARGFTPDQLTAAEQARLKPAKGEPALSRKAPNGTTILTDAGRARLAQDAPAAKVFVPTTEAQDLRGAASKPVASAQAATGTEAKPADASAGAESPAPEAEAAPEPTEEEPPAPAAPAERRAPVYVQHADPETRAERFLDGEHGSAVRFAPHEPVPDTLAYTPHVKLADGSTVSYDPEHHTPADFHDEPPPYTPSGVRGANAPEPVTPEGTQAQRLIDDLSQRRAAQNGFLDPGDEQTLASARETLNRDLNRQALGTNPQPTTEAGHQAKARIEALEAARDAGADLSASDHAAWKRHQQVLESDFTAQRQAREAKQDAPTAPMEPAVERHAPSAPELLSPEEHARATIDAYDHLLPGARKGRTVAANRRQAETIHRALDEGRPVNAEAADAHGIVIPAHYEAEESSGRYVPTDEPPPLSEKGQNYVKALDRLRAQQREGKPLTPGQEATVRFVRDGIAEERRKDAEAGRAAQAPRTDRDLEAEDEARRQYEAELLAQSREGIEGAGGVELLDAVRAAGGIPTNDPVLHGELASIRDASKPGALVGYKGTWNLSRKDAPRLDELTNRLRAAGFAVDTPADTLDLIQRRLMDKKPVYGFAARSEADSGMEGAGAYYRRQGPPRTPEDLLPVQRKYQEMLGRIAPKLAKRLEIIRQAQLQHLWRGQSQPPGDIHAAYLDGTIYLVHEALVANPDKITLLNALHEAAHGYERTLPEGARRALRAQWQNEMRSGKSPLHGPDGKLRAEVDQRAASDFSEWLAERLGWENAEWAQGRAGTKGPIGRFAESFRLLLQRMFNAVRPGRTGTSVAESSARFRAWLTEAAAEPQNAGMDGQEAKAAIRDWFRKSGRENAQSGGRTPTSDVGSEREDVAPKADVDPVTGTHSWLSAAGKNDGGAGGGAVDAAPPQDGQGHAASGLETGAGGDVGRGDRAASGGGTQQQYGIREQARLRGLAVKSYVGDVAAAGLGLETPLRPGEALSPRPLEARASRLLRLTPAAAREQGFSPEAVAALERIRRQVPLLKREELIAHVDAAHALGWHGTQESSAYSDGGSARMEFELQRRTLNELFNNRSGDLERHLSELAGKQRATGASPRLQLIGVGNEGAAFRDAESKMIYKLHPGTESASAYGITRIEPQPDGTTHVAVEKVPLTEAIRRYERQNLVSVAIPTEVAGVTPEGILVTKQREMATEPPTTFPEIEQMMSEAGGVRVHEPGGRQKRQTWAVPDGEGNWLVAADLKPANVLREKATGTPRLTDGILASITPEVLRDNPQLSEFPASNPEAQFARRTLAEQGYRPATNQERERLNIPPRWSDVHVSSDPNARRVAVGKDAKGRVQSLYSRAHTSAAQAAKFNRGRAFHAALPTILSRIRESIASGHGAEEAAVLRLIHRTGFRNGGDADTGGKVKAYGASNLRAEHVRFDGDTTHFDFVGKLGVRQQHSVTDPELTADLRQRAAGGGPLFDTTAAKVLDYLKQRGSFKVHDFRTWKASTLAADTAANLPKPRTQAEFQKARNRVGDVVAKMLGDNRQIALDSYIDPVVFERWKANLAATDSHERSNNAARFAAIATDSDAQPRAGEAGSGRSLSDEPLRERPAARGEDAEIRAAGRVEPQFARRQATAEDPGDWQLFPRESGTLGIPREQMPQIKSTARGALANFLAARGIKVRSERVLPGTLKPSQAEYSPAKVEKARGYEGPQRALVISGDDHVIDGHHEWLKNAEDAPEKPIPVIRAHAPARDILDQIHEFPSAGMDGPPQLRSGERGTGELFQNADQPFNLIGEKGTDGARVAAARAQAEQDTAAARAKQDSEQGTLFARRTVEQPEEEREAAPVSRAPVTVKDAVQTAKAHIEANRPLLARLGIKDVRWTTTKTGSGIEYGTDGSLRISVPKLIKSMEAVGDLQAKKGIAGTPEDWFAATLHHEAVHAADDGVAKQNGQTLKQRYDALPDEALPQGWETAGKKAYGPDWDGLESWEKKGEFARMIVEGRWKGRISEQLYRVLKQTADFLRRVAGGEGTDPRFQQHVDEIAERIEAARHAPEDGSSSQGEPWPSGAQFRRGGVVRAIHDVWNARQTNDRVSYGVDTAENRAGELAHQAANSVRHDFGTEKELADKNSPANRDLQAMPFIVEAGGNRAAVAADLAKVKASSDPALAKRFAPVVEHALANFDRLNKMRGKYEATAQKQLTIERRHGIDAARFQGEVMRRLELPGQQRALVPILLGKGARYAVSGHEFRRLADAIQAGYGPHSTNLADLLEQRLLEGGRMVQTRRLFSQLKAMKVPGDPKGRSLIADGDTVKLPDGTTETRAPLGYDHVEAAGVPLYVHQQYSGLLRALYEPESVIRQHAAGRFALNATALAKHGTLIGDFFHGSKMLFKQATGGGGFGGSKKALALLEHHDADLAHMVTTGEISPEVAAWAKANRPTADELIKGGLNLGKFSDNLLDQVHSFVEKIPGVKMTNDWIFHKVARSAMLQTALANLERNAKNFPELSREQVVRRTAWETNQLFGNLGHQGVLKSDTARDIARLTLLSPQWCESQLRSEVSSYHQLGMAVPDALRGRVRLGSLARQMATGAAAMFALSQAINLATRGQPTWQNEEDDHKLDAWIPGPGGSRGFFFAPLSMITEYAHTMLKYHEHGESVVAAAGHIAANKVAPVARGVTEAITGKDYAGHAFPDDATRWRSAAIDSLPSPMPLGGLIEKDPRGVAGSGPVHDVRSAADAVLGEAGYRVNRQPGSLVKQGAQLAGVKLEAAPSATSRRCSPSPGGTNPATRARHRPFTPNSGVPSRTETKPGPGTKSARCSPRARPPTRSAKERTKSGTARSATSSLLAARSAN